MKRRARNAVRDALHDVVHGRGIESVVQVVETGTCVSARKLGPHRFTIDVILRGEDRVEI